jgi:Asp-tRNA(Asn)/Glu-tRNA(Gln) amidotransferase A subunit family amidase
MSADSAAPSFPPSRRRALQTLAGLGVGTAVFQRSLAAQVGDDGKITAEMVANAQWIAGIELSETEQQAVADALQDDQIRYARLRKVPVRYDVPPALHFFAEPPQAAPQKRGDVRLTPNAAAERPASDDDLAFLSVAELSALLRAKQVSSLELTKVALARLHKYDKLLKCVVTFTDELALAQAKRADEELSAGRVRGPLHGVPWGAKDLIAYPGYKTTWGAGVFQDQTLDGKATVAQRLDDAGAVLVAKLTLGALAWGDEWFGGLTRNPWNPQQGSSGSSAGPASAVAAGLVPFALGSETLGSIVSPCRRCSVTGLRPTFGRVSRHGCMSLAWSMDKIGPMARTVEDCALVFGAIHGADGLDTTAVDRSFSWPAQRPLKSYRVGYFDDGTAVDQRRGLQVLKDLEVTLVPIKLPSTYPIDELTIILTAESAAVFDNLTRRSISDGIGKWAGSFRRGQFIPAIEYLRANRIRTLLMQEMRQLMADLDAYVGGEDLTLTNLTGHPTVVLPDGERSGEGQPGTITFTGKLFGETDLLALAHAYQQATGAHLRRPKLAESDAK